MQNEIIFIILAFIISIISGTIGFGSAMLLIPFSTFLFSIKKAIALITIYFLIINLSKVIIFRKHIDWKTTNLLWFGALPFVCIGSYMMIYAPAVILEKTLGAIIMFYIVNDITGLTKNIRLRRRHIAGAGALFGFFSGIIGTGSAITAALLSHMGLTKEKFIATMSVSALLMNVIKVAIYSESSLIESADTPVLIALAFCAVAGSAIGNKLVKKINPKQFKAIIQAVLVISALKLLIF